MTESNNRRTRFHVDTLNPPILGEETLQLILAGIVLKVAHKDRPHPRWFAKRITLEHEIEEKEEETESDSKRANGKSALKQLAASAPVIRASSYR